MLSIRDFANLVGYERGVQSVNNAGMGVETQPDSLTKDDDDFSMYRKRMMLAYKFRPNPMVSS
jgi:splicing factor 4